jgi:hypothetical protein
MGLLCENGTPPKGRLGGGRTLVRMELAHYAEAFTTQRGRCWRFVAGDDPRRQGQPSPCLERVTMRGTFRPPDNRHWRVDSCPGHAGSLRDRRPITLEGELFDGGAEASGSWMQEDRAALEGRSTTSWARSHQAGGSDQRSAFAVTRSIFSRLSLESSFMTTPAACQSKPSGHFVEGSAFTPLRSAPSSTASLRSAPPSRAP